MSGKRLPGIDFLLGIFFNSLRAGNEKPAH